MVVGVLAILKADAAYVPIDRDQWPQERIENVLAQVSSELVVYTGRKMMTLPAGVTAAISAEEDGQVEPDDDGSALAERGADLAAIIFTSGTTGKPKGVMVRDDSLARFVTRPHFNYDVTPDDRVLLVLSVAFDGEFYTLWRVDCRANVGQACMGTLFNTLCNGGTVVLADKSNFQQRARQCSVIVATPSILDALESPSSPSDYPLLDRIVLGGETPSQKLLERWNVLQRPVWIAYGPTEATCASLTGLIQKCPQTGEYRPTILGSVIDGAEVTIVDDDGKDIDDVDQEGELLISGAGLAAGYWRDECRTKEKFTIRNGKRTYWTGDRARWTVVGDGQKVVDFCGRRDRTVKIRGFLVNLDLDVDAAMAALDPRVQSVFSVKIGKKLCTAISPVLDDVDGLKCRWRAKAPAYLVPDVILSVDALPTTANGKIDARKLRDLLETSIPRADEAHVFTTPTDVVLSGLSQILDVPAASFDVTQPFISQGVHSLAAAMLSSHCRKHHLSITVPDILTASSISEVLEAAQTLQAARAAAAPRPRRDVTEGPLTTLQKMLIYGSAQNAARNVVQHVASYRRSDVGRLRTAWQAVVAAEPMFRTHFDMDTLTQRVAGEAPFRWSECDARSRREVERLMGEAARATGLGSSFVVMHCPGDESILVWSTHHALIDGFSASLVLNNVAAALAGRPFEPSPPFAAAAEALSQVADRTAVEADVFWRQQKQRFPNAAGDILLPKPTDAPTDAAHAEHAVETGLDAAALAGHAQATPAAVYYAAWALTLASYANSDTVVFGAVLSARSLQFDGAERTVGPLVHSRPLHFSIDRDASAAATAAAMHRAIQALARVQAADPKDDDGPVHFASAVAIQYDAPPLDRPAVEPLRPPSVRESTDIALNVLVEAGGRVRFLYRSDLFSEYHVRHMACVYANLLRSLARPDAIVRECMASRLSPEVADMLLAVGNHPSPMTYTVERHRNIATAIEEAARANADRVAVEKGPATLTYAELMASANKVAAVAERIVQPGDVVCVVADRSINWIIGAAAVFKAGGCYCPLDAAHSVEYRAELLRSSGATLLLCPDSAQLRDPMPGGPVAVAIDQILASGVEPKRTPPRLQSSLAPAFLCFTSGSTGKPKGNKQRVP